MIKAKKSLGQNFLIDNNILEKIVTCADIENKTVLEVGPGTGNLTNFILNKQPKKLFVIEKDYELAENLKEKFKNTPNVYYQESIEQAIRSIKMDDGDLLLVTGSLYLCTEVLNLN